MSENTDEASAPTHVSRSDLLQDALVFQIKLAIDGIRDFLLIPVSMIAAAISFFGKGDGVGREFYDVVAFGRDTEKKINLFSAADRVYPSDEVGPGPDLDTLVDGVERYVRDAAGQERFAAAKARLREMLDKMDRKQKTQENMDE
jgi:hypothetical protein